MVLAKADWKTLFVVYVLVIIALEVNCDQPSLVYASKAPNVVLYLIWPTELWVLLWAVVPAGSFIAPVEVNVTAEDILVLLDVIFVLVDVIFVLVAERVRLPDIVIGPLRVMTLVNCDNS